MVAVFAFLTDRRRCTAAIGLLLFLFALSLWQAWRLGGFRSDLGGDPDEGAHAVTALMLRDYLTTGLSQGRSPLAFAEHYYQTFPKVALGHYPPGYYLPAAAALALWCDPRSLILLQCLLVSCLGVAAFLMVCRAWAGQGRLPVALLTALTVVLHGEVSRVSVHVLADLLLVLLVLAAAVAWMAWLRKPSWKRSFGFGVIAAAAILTKGSALGLAGIPLFSLLLTRRWTDLKNPSWWGAGIPVAMLAGPWMMWSVRFTQEGFTGDSPAAFFVKAVGEYAVMAPWFFGWPVLLLLAVAFGRSLIEALRAASGLDVFRACLWATCLGMQGIAMVVPAGFSPRYMLPSLVPVLVLVVLEWRHWLRAGRSSLDTGMAVLTLGVTIFSLWRDRPKEVHGYAKAVETVLARQTARGDRAWLVSSDGRGEGALIAAVAFRTPDRVGTMRRILRGSKELADTDWGGRHYEPKFPDDASLLAHFDKSQVDVIFVDMSMTAAERKPHETRLKQALDEAPQVWQKLADQPVSRLAAGAPGSLGIYCRIRAEGGTSAP